MDRSIPYIKPFISAALLGYNEVYRNEKLKRLLSKRKRYYNNRFKFNAEDLKRFELVNQLLRRRSSEAYMQAEKIEDCLLIHIQQPDSFVSDYEIEFRVELWAERKYGYLEELHGNPFFTFKPSLMSFRKKSLVDNEEDEHKSFLFEENLNEYPGTFIGQRHCSLLHDLYDHTYLSFQDIIDIEEVWIEISVMIQNFTKIEQ
jgi:hypothetical protein